MSDQFKTSTIIRLLALNVPVIMHWITGGAVSLALPAVIFSSLVLGHWERTNAQSYSKFIGPMTLSAFATTVLSFLNPAMWFSGSGDMSLPGWLGLPVFFVISWVFSCMGAVVYRFSQKG